MKANRFVALLLAFAVSFFVFASGSPNDKGYIVVADYITTDGDVSDIIQKIIDLSFASSAC